MRWQYKVSLFLLVLSQTAFWFWLLTTQTLESIIQTVILTHNLDNCVGVDGLVVVVPAKG